MSSSQERFPTKRPNRNSPASRPLSRICESRLSRNSCAVRTEQDEGLESATDCTDLHGLTGNAPSNRCRRRRSVAFDFHDAVLNFGRVSIREGGVSKMITNELYLVVLPMVHLGMNQYGLD